MKNTVYLSDLLVEISPTIIVPIRNTTTAEGMKNCSMVFIYLLLLYL